MLRIYRRHLATCQHSSERYRRCACPIYVEGSLAGEEVRKSLDLTSWEAASDLVTQWNASGQIGVVRVEIPPITEAIAKFFEDANARGLKPPTIQKLRYLLEKRLIPWCDDRGYRHLKQLDVDALRQFRATWPDAPISAHKNLERLRSFFRFCQQAEWVKANHVMGVKLPKIGNLSAGRPEVQKPEGFEKSGAKTTAVLRLSALQSEKANVARAARLPSAFFPVVSGSVLDYSRRRQPCTAGYGVLCANESTSRGTSPGDCARSPLDSPIQNAGTGP
jgi:hypothetical protein